MSALSVVTNLFRRGADGVVLPSGQTLDAWRKDVEAERGEGYAPLVSLLMRVYNGQSRADTVTQLQRSFPETFSSMSVVTLPVLRKIVTERAQVFGGDGESFAWLVEDEDGNAAEFEPFAGIVQAAQLPYTAKAVDRRVELTGRVFVRVTWDVHGERVRLSVFTSDNVFPRWPADTRDIDACEGIVVAIEPAVENGKAIKRWEFWSPKENFIVDASGRATAPADDYPYAHDDGSPCVPFVSFGAESEDVGGYWPPPREDWLDTQRTISVSETNLIHLSRVAGYGIMKSETKNDVTAEPWPAQTVMAPLEVLEVPRGRTLDHVSLNADFAGLGATVKEHLGRVATLNDLPPGAILSEGRQVPSGVALQIERAPLMEVREDRADVYEAPVARLLEVMRVVHNAHCADADKIPEGSPRWTRGDTAPPRDVEASMRLDEARIRIGTSSAVRLLMRDEGMTREDAMVRAKEIEEEKKITTTRTGALFAAPAASPLTQSREP